MDVEHAPQVLQGYEFRQARLGCRLHLARVLAELQRLPFAEELGKTRLERVAEVAHLEEYEAGTLLFRAGCSLLPRFRGWAGRFFCGWLDMGAT